jgi:hypothetical protein
MSWSSLKTVPGWFGSEDQGAAVAIAQRSGYHYGGPQDLYVFHVDNPGGENHGYYRVGFDLDASGNVGSWSDIKPVPGWFGSEDQGAGIAVGPIGGWWQNDLVVFHVDNPGGENQGYYRIGWALDQAGNVTGGWSPVKPVPGWFGSEDQGGGVALAWLRGLSPALIVFNLDNPGGENHGYYRIGWDLDQAGNVTGGWSPVKPIPGWFGSENQYAGIATWNINKDSSWASDLVVFHIDNPGGENHGYYRIGWDLNSNGDVAGWSDVKAVPGWFGSEDQGAGIAIGSIGQRYDPDLLVFHVDNPGGENHGYYRVGWDMSPSGDIA